MRIPLFDPAPAIERDRAALHEAFSRVLAGGSFVLGPEVERFEQALSGWLGSSQAVGEVVGVASGSDALELALRALDIGPGQAVVTTAFSFVATVEAIAHVGATPVLADVRASDWLLDLEPITRHLRSLPRSPAGRPQLPSGDEVTALLPVHLFGAVCDAAALRALSDEFGLWLIEDTAQALGGSHGPARAGALGHAGCFSFFPSKTLGGFGDGGAVWVRDKDTAERLRALRQHGQRCKGVPSAMLGRNSRLDALQAALLAIKLTHLDDDIHERRALVRRYLSGLLPCSPWLETLAYPDLDGHAAQQMIVRSPHRDALAARLRERGVGTAVYYPLPLHQLTPYSRCPRLGPLPCAEQAASESLALPLYPGMPLESVDEVVALCSEFAAF